MLVYDEALYKFTKGAGVEFLPCRVWIAIWTMIIAIVVAGFQGSVVVKYFTRFTKDIFAGFVATVFIYEALLQTVGVNKNALLDSTKQFLKPGFSTIHPPPTFLSNPLMHYILKTTRHTTN